MNAETFTNDIPTDIARAAYAGISFTPDKRAEQVRDGYAEQMAQDFAELSKLTVGKDGMAETLRAEFARYRDGYQARYLAKLRSDSRCMSVMITGPSNFPTRRNEKRNNIAHKRLEELLEFRNRALAAIRKTLCPELRPIMAGDSDATERLKTKIADAEKLQERMKAANVIVRKFKNDVSNGRLALEQAGFPAGVAKALFEPDFCGRLGFPSYELTNNNANIQRMKGRLVVIARNQDTPASEAQGSNATLEDCPAENRVRLTFPGKPSVDVRTQLKSSGFRWTPSLGVWQAYRNERNVSTAKQLAGIQ